jgi:hypothetical protein
VGARSWLLRKGAVAAFGAGVLVAAFLPAAASAVGAPSTVPVTTFAVTTTQQCSGPTLLPAVTSLVNQLIRSLGGLGGTPGSGTVPGFSSCTATPALLSSLLGTASASSTASANGSASVSAQADGNALSVQSAQEFTELTGSITLSSAASSVDFSIPYTNTAFATTGVAPSGNDASSFVSFMGGAAELNACVDGSSSIWSLPTGEFDLEAPLAAGSGTYRVHVSCPDGSNLAPGAIDLIVNLNAEADSGDNSQAAASANISMHDVTAAINP